VALAHIPAKLCILLTISEEYRKKKKKNYGGNKITAALKPQARPNCKKSFYKTFQFFPVSDLLQSFEISAIFCFLRSIPKDKYLKY
jgi:hypothetical protein